MPGNELIKAREELANFFFLERIKKLPSPKDVVEEAERLIEQANRLSEQHPKAKPIMAQCIANFKHELRNYWNSHRTELEDESSSNSEAA